MTSMDEYLQNPEWAKFYRYSMGPPNGGYYKRWIQGSSGMMEPLPLWSNEYGFTYMKHGQNNIVPYRGNIQPFAPSVSPSLMRQVAVCTYETVNPGGCQNEAIRKVFTNDSSQSYMSEFSQDPPATSPHPFGVSYRTGFSPKGRWIPPNGPQD